MPQKVGKPKRNAEEGGTPEFWDNDIDSDVDDKWQAMMEDILNTPKIAAKDLITLLRKGKTYVNE